MSTKLGTQENARNKSKMPSNLINFTVFDHFFLGGVLLSPPPWGPNAISGVCSVLTVPMGCFQGCSLSVAQTTFVYLE